MRIPPPWMIEELKRRRREQEEQGRQISIEIPEPVAPATEQPRRERQREPIVIELW